MTNINNITSPLCALANEELARFRAKDTA